MPRCPAAYADGGASKGLATGCGGDRGHSQAVGDEDPVSSQTGASSRAARIRGENTHPPCADVGGLAGAMRHPCAAAWARRLWRGVAADLPGLMLNSSQQCFVR